MGMNITAATVCTGDHECKTGQGAALTNANYLAEYKKSPTGEDLTYKWDKYCYCAVDGEFVADVKDGDGIITPMSCMNPQPDDFFKGTRVDGNPICLEKIKNSGTPKFKARESRETLSMSKYLEIFGNPDVQVDEARVVGGDDDAEEAEGEEADNVSETTEVDKDGFNWKLWLGVGGGVLCFLILVILFISMGKKGSNNST